MGCLVEDGLIIESPVNDTVSSELVWETRFLWFELNRLGDEHWMRHRQDDWSAHIFWIGRVKEGWVIRYRWDSQLWSQKAKTVSTE